MRKGVGCYRVASERGRGERERDRDAEREGWEGRREGEREAEEKHRTLPAAIAK